MSNLEQNIHFDQVAENTEITINKDNLESSLRTMNFSNKEAVQGTMSAIVSELNRSKGTISKSDFFTGVTNIAYHTDAMKKNDPGIKDKISFYQKICTGQDADGKILSPDDITAGSGQEAFAQFFVGISAYNKKEVVM